MFRKTFFNALLFVFRIFCLSFRSTKRHLSGHQQREKNISRQYILSVSDHLDIKSFFYQETGVLHFFMRRRIMREEKTDTA